MQESIESTVMEGSSNLILTFFLWWYGEAITKLFVFLKTWLIYLADMFSVRACLTTLFAPWKRDQISYNGLSLQQRFQVLIMNLASRIIGAIVKLGTVSAYLMVTILALAVIVLLVVVWVCWPFIAILLFSRGLALSQGGN